MQSDRAGFEALHSYFLDRLVPVCAQLLEAARHDGELRSDIGALELMHGVGNLCIGTSGDGARQLVGLLIAGLRATD